MIESLSIANTATYGLTPQVLDRLKRFNFLFGSNGAGGAAHVADGHEGLFFQNQGAEVSELAMRRGQVCSG